MEGKRVVLKETKNVPTESGLEGIQCIFIFLGLKLGPSRWGEGALVLRREKMIRKRMDGTREKRVSKGNNGKS